MTAPAPARPRLGLAPRTALAMSALVLVATAVTASIAGQRGQRDFADASQRAVERGRQYVAGWIAERLNGMVREADAVKENAQLRALVLQGAPTALPGLGPTGPAPERRCRPPDAEGDEPHGTRAWVWENVAEATENFASLRDAASHGDRAARVAWALVSTRGELLFSYHARLRDKGGCEIDYRPAQIDLLGAGAFADAACTVVPAADSAVAASGLFAARRDGAFFTCAVPLEGDDRAVWARLVLAEALDRSFFEDLKRVTGLSMAVLRGGTVVASTPGFSPGSGLAAQSLPAAEARIGGDPWRVAAGRFPRMGAREPEAYLVGWPLAPEYARLRRTLGDIALGGLLASALGFALAFAYVRRGWIADLARIGHALRGIRRRSESPDDTAWPPRLRLLRRDEIGELSESLDSMVDGLEVYEQALRRFASPEIVRLLRTAVERHKLDARRVELTVLFTDIANFTHLSEGRDPAQVKELLDEYLATMTRAALSHGAYIDKFIGDAVMAIWGAPGDPADHAVRACAGALALRDAARELERRYGARGWPGLRTRLGLNSGPMMVGLVGPEDKSAYTVLGDEVNLASRLEGVNKVYGTELLASGATVLAAGSAVAAREIDRVRVKGKDRPVAIFELVAMGGIPAERREALRRYAESLALYRDRRFADARAVFEAAAAVAPGGDPAAAAMARRCAELVLAPPPEGWDGSFALDAK